MSNPAKLALPLLLAYAATSLVAMHAQTHSIAPVASVLAAFESAPQSPQGAKSRRGKSSTAPKSTATGKPATGAPRAGLHGTAPAEDATITVTGGKGDTTTGIDPKTGSLNLPQIPNALGVRSGTLIHLRLLAPADSGHAKNGDMLDGVLTAPLGKAPAGAPVKLTVVASVPAGSMTSAGELSVQVVTVNGENMLSNVITAEGEQGKTLQPDGAPGRGTEAIFTPDKPLELPAA